VVNAPLQAWGNVEKHKSISFDVFTIDAASESLWRGSERIHLRPKSFAFLLYLATHPGQMIPKEKLLDVLWKGCFVGDGALKHCIAEIRKALGDPADKPRFVETAHRRGYRFICEISKDAQLAAGSRQSRNPPIDDPLVGRKTELALLQNLLEKAIEGARQIVFVTGEMGIGKTTLVDAFLKMVSPESPSRDNPGLLKNAAIARGQCMRSHGAGEAYMPVCEALTGLCRNSDKKRIVSILRQHAPLWLLQMPSLINTAQLEALRRTTLGATRERMLREMADALETLATEIPLILVLEDLHWSDYSTLDLISYLAQRRASVRLLLIGTCRPTEAMTEGDPLRNLKSELKAHQQCLELSVELLSESAVSEYLKRRFIGHKFPAETATWIHRRTAGNPLFMTNLLDHLVSRGFIVRRDHSHILSITLDKAAFEVPPTIQEIIEHQIKKCNRQEQRLIEAASVVGTEFPVSAVAAVLHEKPDWIASVCASLSQRRIFLEPADLSQTKGKQEVRYKFSHGLYQVICYQRLSEALRSRLHRSVAAHIEKENREQLGSVAGRLAMHYEQGHEYGRALHYYQQAANNANWRYAAREALELAERGMHVLEIAPSLPDKANIEMSLQISLGNGLLAIRGLGSEDVKRAFDRAAELFGQLRKQRSRKNEFQFSALWGLWNYSWTRAEYTAARELAEQLFQMAEAAQDPVLLNQANFALGIIMMDHGEFTGALQRLEQNPAVVSRVYAALVLWYLGYPNRAMKSLDETLAQALEAQNAEECIFTYVAMARIHAFRREAEKAYDRAQAAQGLAIQNGWPELWLIPMRVMSGWARVKIGQIDEGMKQVSQALAEYQRIGDTNITPYLLAVFSEILADAGKISEGLATIQEALNVSLNTGMRYHEAEIYRVKGELLRQEIGAVGKFNENNQRLSEAEVCFKKAIQIARQQKAKSFELRATTSLTRLLQGQNRPAEARKSLSRIVDAFTEGHDTLDLCEALQLLRDLS
jgi:DNA-binding winged helix-turn-helix (wHTH) protein/predicted ATPase